MRVVLNIEKSISNYTTKYIPKYLNNRTLQYFSVKKMSILIPISYFAVAILSGNLTSKGHRMPLTASTT